MSDQAAVENDVPTPGTVSDAADQIAEARRRARHVLAGESHLGAPDDWRRVPTIARDVLVLLWLIWVGLHGLGDPPMTGWLLVALTFGLATLIGISAARSVYTQVQDYVTELEKERVAVRDNVEQERDELRALYAAKGFQEPLLSKVVETLSADDDRLLKVMMEEELGLSVSHLNHPLIVGLWSFAGALIAGLLLTLPPAMGSAEMAAWWMPVGGLVLLLILAILSARITGGSGVEFFSVGLVMALVTGGMVYYLAQWFGGWMPATTAI